VGHKNGTEAAIQARLRELAEEVRRLRRELSEEPRSRTLPRERTIAHVKADRGKKREPRE
jgi:hypothetical protein